MTLHEQVDEVLYGSGRWMTVSEVARAIRAMFAVNVGLNTLTPVLDSELAWGASGDGRYVTNSRRRGDWLVQRFGLDS